MQTRVIYAVTLIICLTLFGCALVISGVVRDSFGNERNLSEINRYSIHNEFPGGYNIFDSKTGKVCSVPNGNVSNLSMVCTEAPR